MAWTVSASVRASAALAAGATANNDADLSATGSTRVRLVCRATFASRPDKARTQGVYIGIFPSVDDGTYFATKPMKELYLKCNETSLDVSESVVLENVPNFRCTSRNTTDVSATVEIIAAHIGDGG